MSELEATSALVLAFALRCIVPLAATLLIGFLMNRISDRWEREETVRRGGIALPVAIHPVCWITKKCNPARRDKCPAYQQSHMACWQARQESLGRLPNECEDCPLHMPAFA